MQPLIEVKNLSTHFCAETGIVKAADGVSIHVGRGETVALVGESGCGKTAICLSIMRLIRPPGRIVSGEVWFDGINLLNVSQSEMRKILGARIAMIFQEPMLCFDPVYSVGAQITETFAQHKGLAHNEALRKTIELLNMVGIADPERRVHSYPHEFSGGMLQRAMIALAISCEPKFLIADEPTTSLDVTIQAQILELLAQITKMLGMSVLLITHNFGIVSRYAKRAYVMYAGQIVESGPVEKLYKQPRHPYTAELWASVLRLDRSPKSRMLFSGGTVMDLSTESKGCAYFPRCKEREPNCERDKPELIAIDSSHFARCHRALVSGGIKLAE